MCSFPHGGLPVIHAAAGWSMCQSLLSSTNNSTHRHVYSHIFVNVEHRCRSVVWSASPIPCHSCNILIGTKLVPMRPFLGLLCSAFLLHTQRFTFAVITWRSTHTSSSSWSAFHLMPISVCSCSIILYRLHTFRLVKRANLPNSVIQSI